MFLFCWPLRKGKLTWILSLIWLDKLSRFLVILEKSWSPSDVCNIHSLNLHSQDWKCIKKCSELYLYAWHVWGREQPRLQWHHKTRCIMSMNWTEVMIPYKMKSTYMSILSWEALFQVVNWTLGKVRLGDFPSVVNSTLGCALFRVLNSSRFWEMGVEHVLLRMRNILGNKFEC